MASITHSFTLNKDRGGCSQHPKRTVATGAPATQHTPATATKHIYTHHSKGASAALGWSQQLRAAERLVVQEGHADAVGGEGDVVGVCKVGLQEGRKQQTRSSQQVSNTAAEILRLHKQCSTHTLSCKKLPTKAHGQLSSGSVHQVQYSGWHGGDPRPQQTHTITPPGTAP